MTFISNRMPNKWIGFISNRTSEDGGKEDTSFDSRERAKCLRTELGVGASIRAIQIKHSLTVEFQENLANRICESKALRSAIWSTKRQTSAPSAGPCKHLPDDVCFHSREERILQ